MRVSASILLGSLEDITDLLETLTRINVRHMQTRALPALYESGVRYRREPLGQEKWWPARDVVRQGHGDCEDLCAYRAAELIRAGVDAKAVCYSPRAGLVHCIVVYRRPDGTLAKEDPSRVLGMGGEG